MSTEYLPLRLKLCAVRTDAGGESYAEDLRGLMVPLSRDHGWLAHQALGRGFAVPTRGSTL